MTRTVRYSDALAEAHTLIGAIALRLDNAAHPDSLFNGELIRVMEGRPPSDWVRLVRSLCDIADVLSRLAAGSSGRDAAGTLQYAVDRMREHSKKFEPDGGTGESQDS